MSVSSSSSSLFAMLSTSLLLLFLIHSVPDINGGIINVAIENLSNKAIEFKFKTNTIDDTFVTISPGDVAWDIDNAKMDLWSTISLNLVGCENQNNVEVVFDVVDYGITSSKWVPYAHVWNFPEVGKRESYCADWRNSINWKESNDRDFIIPGTHFENNKYIGCAIKWQVFLLSNDFCMNSRMIDMELACLKNMYCCFVIDPTGYNVGEY